MTRILRPTLPFLASLAFLLLSAYACGDDPAGPDLQDDISFLVGDWVADVLVATGIEDPQLSRDLLAEGADFGINVQPSGASSMDSIMPA